MSLSQHYIHNINPFIFQTESFSLSWYWFFYPLSFFICYFLILKIFRDPPPKTISNTTLHDFLIASWLGVLIGGRLGYVLFYNLEFFTQNPSLIPQFWTGGMSFHGALFGAGLACWLVSKFKKTDFFTFTDLALTVAPIALLLGRLGNFINGELWGRTTQWPLAVIFPLSGDSHPRHPSQLYEAFLEGFVLFILLFFWKRQERLSQKGKATMMFLSLYFFFRFIVEFFREPDSHIGLLWFNISMGQWLSLAGMAVTYFIWIKIKKLQAPLDKSH